MANIRFILSKRVRADGKSEVYVRLALNRTKFVQVRTGIYVTSSLFVADSISGKSKVGHVEVPKRGKLNSRAISEAQQVESELQDYASRLQRVCLVCDKEIVEDRKKLAKAISATRDVPMTELTAKLVADRLSDNTKTNDVALTIYDYADMYLRATEQPERRAAHLRTAMRMVKRWETYKQIKNGSFAINIDNLTTDEVNDLRMYIGNEAELKEKHPKIFKVIDKEYPEEIDIKSKGNNAIKKRGSNSVINIMKRIKTFWNWLLENHKTNNNPFDGVKIGTARYGVPFYMTIEERNRLADYDMNSRPKLAIQRDIFVFQCLIGCRVGDLYKLTEANITGNILEYVPHKTKDEEEQVKPRIPLNERARALVEKYKGVDKRGRLFPFISQQRYNDAIKDALSVAGIDRNVIVRNALTGENEIRPICEVASSHMARRTFVGTAYGKVKDPNIIGKMSGHVEGSRAFNRYRAITDDVLKEVIDLIE